MRRREFLRGASAVVVPAVLGGCSLGVPVTSRVPRPEDPYLAELDVDDRTLSAALAALGSGGADLGEIYFQQRWDSRMRLADGEPRTPVRNGLRGAGLRAVRDGRVGFAATEDTGEAALLAAAKAAAGDAEPGRATAPGPRRFAPPGSLYPADTAWREVDDSRRLDILRSVDRKTRAYDPAVTAVDVTLADADEWILIATLDGRLVADKRPMTRLSLEVTMTRGQVSHTGFASAAGRRSVDWYAEERLDALVETAAGNAAILFDARRPPAGELPVVLAAGTSGILLHEALGHAFEADFVAEGRSPISAAMGDRLGSEALSLADDPTVPGVRGALHVDDEGERGQRTVLVEQGRLRSLLHDRMSAARAGVAPTGNGRRQSFRDPPMPRMTTLVLEPGEDTPEALLAEMDRGILAETFTGGRADVGGGDFRFRVRHGWYVENGKKRVPVRDFELVGNGPELLRDVRMVANDFRLDPAGWSCGKKDQEVPVAHGTPSFLVARLGVLPLS